MVAITLCSLATAGVSVYLLAKVRRRMCHPGITFRVSPQLQPAIKEMVVKRFSLINNIYRHLYHTCNSYPKDKDRLADYLVEEFTTGGIRNLSNDIVYIADLGEGGRLSSMAREYRLSEAELRTCCYIHLGFKWQQTCTAENLTENAYNVRCSRIRKKLSMEKDERIPDFIKGYCSSADN